MPDIIGYYRVSTQDQGESGLGLEAQKAAVVAYSRQVNGRIRGEYVEVESGKRNNRPELARALAHARRSKAVLAVGVLDRLSRNSYLINQLLETKVDFVDCQAPHDPPMVTRIKAALAQDEVEKIAKRTRDALRAAKARGTVLGSARAGHWDGNCRCPECKGDPAKQPTCPACGGTGTTNVSRRDARLAGLSKATAASVASRRKKAVEFYIDLVPEIIEYRANGLSLRAIAAKLNDAGHTTRRGRPWNPVQVAAVLSRSAACVAC
jgi:DNA invertase Pin-like site-specific DNA recombinase